jgi:anti-anti-sigma regulatory factor
LRCIRQLVESTNLAAQQHLFFQQLTFGVGRALLHRKVLMLRIRRTANGEVVFTLSGEIRKEHVAELEALIAAEVKDRRIILDLKDMTLTGQDGIAFLARCEAAGIALANCDPYVREWIRIQDRGF